MKRTRRTGKTVHTTAEFVRPCTADEEQDTPTQYYFRKPTDLPLPCLIRTVHGERLLYAIETPPVFRMPAPYKPYPRKGSDLAEWAKRAKA